MKEVRRTFLLWLVTGAYAPLHGGTIITNNLPDHTAIININAREDGAAVFNGAQTLWYRPFNSRGNLLTHGLRAGTYRFRVIDPADAARMYPALTAEQTNQIFTAWTYNSPWILNYLVFPGAAANDTSVPQLFDGDPEWPPFGNPVDAYNASLQHGTYDLIRYGPLGRASPLTARYYTLTNNETLIFVIPDYGLDDNAGGVSVLITPSGPQLDISAAAAQVTLRWATNYDGFSLASANSLPTATWTDVTNRPVVVGTNYSVTLPMEAASRFFQLHKP